MATVSENGCQFLKRWEGYSNPSIQLKGEKYYTVGFGHYGPDVKPNTKYSDEEIKRFFAKDSARFNANVNKIYNTAKGMTQNMFDAMFSFAYNHGNITNTTLGQTISSNPLDFKKIQQIWESSYVNKGTRYEKGLRNRRKAEAQLYCGQQYDADITPSDDTYSEGTKDEDSFKLEENKMLDVASGVNDEDYDVVNSNSFEVRIDDGWEQYTTFDIKQDDQSRVLGQNQLLLNRDDHGKPDDPDEHKLITDETLKPSIAQDEHSAPLKEDTDTREEDMSKSIEKEQINWVGVPHGGGFAI